MSSAPLNLILSLYTFFGVVKLYQSVHLSKFGSFELDFAPYRQEFGAVELYQTVHQE